MSKDAPAHTDTVQTLLIMLASVIPSGPAAPLASMEWRAIRQSWLVALGEGGLSEAEARKIEASARASVLADFLAKTAPEGSA
ncbi:MAG: hypothetical protein Q8L59_11175 [Phenylobacterium sp.]|uniref:hypothetical protein n=1 Tax=Phenylobacterium sp. TaxID=1871053 RepID=UPI0027339084|nr:hypothetical protein [Phenylobacterium sp.]MDP1642736.1 hypothetical protein [Phenylobacterium sp.]MDP3117216.1 hypothetical protein [Phenylobacterium sp.]